MVIIYRGMVYAKMFYGRIASPPRILTQLKYSPQGVRIIVESKSFEIMEKFYSSKTLLKLAGGRGCISHTPPPETATAHRPHAARIDFECGPRHNFAKRIAYTLENVNLS